MGMRDADVDEFFSRSDKVANGSIPIDELDEDAVNVMHLLQEKKLQLGPAYRDFAAAVASDPRIDRFLPEIAIKTVYDYEHEFANFKAIDKNGNRLLSKDEVLNARANDQFDALQQAAIAVLSRNYDSLRTAASSDGLLWGNSSNVTSDDLCMARFNADWGDRYPREQRAISYLLKHFDAIDRNHNGLISPIETSDWLSSHQNGRYRFYSGFDHVVPHAKPQDLLSARRLSRQDLKSSFKWLSDLRREHSRDWQQ